MVDLFAYLFGIAGVLTNCIMYRRKDRQALLKAKLVSDILWGMHYFLISAYSGAITCAIAILREIVFLNRSHSLAKSQLWLVGFLLCNATSICLTWKGIVSVIPALASMISIFLFWIGNPDLTRRVQIPISLAYFVYNFSNRSYLGMLNEVLSLLSIFTFRK